MAIDPKELEICHKRGHDAPLLGQNSWLRCKWCGMWLRKKEVIEEREDDPPPKTRSTLSPNTTDRASAGLSSLPKKEGGIAGLRQPGESILAPEKAVYRGLDRVLNAVRMSSSPCVGCS
jgi:hypothetical protein